MSAPGHRLATVEDFLAIPEGDRFHELLAGEIVERASPTGEHGDAQAGVVAAVRPGFQRGTGRGGPGGWWISTEVEVLLSTGDLVRPDVVGWRRDRVPERPTGAPIAVRPDWVCEVVSKTSASRDLVQKLRIYFAAGIPHYWIVDPRDQTLTVQRRDADGWKIALRAARGERVHAEPFDAIEIEVGTLFGDDPSE